MKMKNLEINGKLEIYRVADFRDVDPDPFYQDFKYFTDEQSAVKYCEDNPAEEVGFQKTIDLMFLEIEDDIDLGYANDILENIENLNPKDLELDGALHYFDENKGEKLKETGVLVFYRHHRYMNYSFDILDIKYVRDTKYKYQSELIEDADSTSAVYINFYDDLEELIKFYEDGESIFSKINSGSKIIENFIS